MNLPVNPYERTGRTGKGGLRRLGESRAADALVVATDQDGHRWIVMIERGDGHGWAVPGGHVDPGEPPAAAAVRELEEETGLDVLDAPVRTLPTRYVPDPRATDHAWMVTTPSVIDLGGPYDTRPYSYNGLPDLFGADDARRAAWCRADSYTDLTRHLAEVYAGQVFAAHVPMLRDFLDTPEVTR